MNSELLGFVIVMACAVLIIFTVCLSDKTGPVGRGYQPVDSGGVKPVPPGTKEHEEILENNSLIAAQKKCEEQNAVLKDRLKRYQDAYLAKEESLKTWNPNVRLEQFAAGEFLSYQATDETVIQEKYSETYLQYVDRPLLLPISFIESIEVTKKGASSTFENAFTLNESAPSNCIFSDKNRYRAMSGCITGSYEESVITITMSSSRATYIYCDPRFVEILHQALVKVWTHQ